MINPDPVQMQSLFGLRQGYSPKFRLVLCGVKQGASRVAALRTLSEETGMSIKQADWALKQCPQLPLCTPEAESLREVLLSPKETQHAYSVLSPHFDIVIGEAGESVLLIPNAGGPPWEAPTGGPTG